MVGFGASRIIAHQGYTTRVLGVLAYQAPELIHVIKEAATDAQTDEEIFMDLSALDGIFSDSVTTKTDVYAYAMVALEVCSALDIVCKGGAFALAS